MLILSFITGCKGKKEAVNASEAPINSVTATQTAAPTNSILPTESVLPSVTADEKISDYYPFKENVRYYYEGKGNEYAEYDVQNEFISDNLIQQRVSNPGTISSQIIKVENGKIIKEFSQAETYYRENFLKKTSKNEEILLMEPIQKGTSWVLKDSSVRTITSVSADVTIPLGKYKAIEVTTQSSNDKTISYFVKNIGLVKSVFVLGEGEISSSLAKIEENVPLIQRVNFYFPNNNTNKLNYYSKDIRFKTNDITKEILSAAYKDTAKKLGYVFTTNTKINSLYMNKDGAVYLDLNKAFLTELTATAANEKRILQCIANTFGQYYNTDKLLLTIDNKPYKSKNITLKKGEYLKTNYTNSVEIKQ